MLPKKLATLANEARLHEAELRADLQQYYGIDFDHAMAGAHSPHHVACLVEQLPPDARLRVAESKDCVWNLEHVLLASIFNSVNSLIYGLGDPRKRGNPPKPIGPEWMTRGKMRSLPARVMPVESLVAELSKPRR